MNGLKMGAGEFILMQTRTQSLVESITNILIGYTVAIASQLISFSVI